VIDFAQGGMGVRWTEKRNMEAVSRARDDNPGLLRFKAGLGVREVELEAASFCPKPFVELKVHTAFCIGLAWIKP
jgi:hypothetical protein